MIRDDVNTAVIAAEQPCTCKEWHSVPCYACYCRERMMARHQFNLTQVPAPAPLWKVSSTAAREADVLARIEAALDDAGAPG